MLTRRHLLAGAGAAAMTAWDTGLAFQPPIREGGD